MSFNWELFVDLAEKLINNREFDGIEEAYLRTAINRSYYGVYGLACKFLKDKGRLSTSPTHREVREKYIKSTDQLEKDIGENLFRLFRDRRKADYKSRAQINKNEAQRVYQLSCRTRQKLKELGI